MRTRAICPTDDPPAASGSSKAQRPAPLAFSISDFSTPPSSFLRGGSPGGTKGSFCLRNAPSRGRSSCATNRAAVPRINLSSSLNLRSTNDLTLRQLHARDPFPEKRPLDQVALDLRGALHDPPRPGVPESARDGMHLFIRRGSGGLQGKIDRPVEQLGRKEFHRGRFEANVEALVGLPGAVVSDDAKRLQLTAQMAERSREPVALTPSRREQPGNPAQDSQRGTVGANAHLKAPRAEPGLVQFPAFPYFAQDLAF